VVHRRAGIVRTEGKNRANTSVGDQIENIASGKNLSDMLVTGEIDALLTAQVPLPYVKRAPQIKRLFSDPRLVEAEHFRRTGIFPIMHVMVIREEFYRRLLGLPKVFTKHYSNRRGIVSRRSIEMTPSIQCFPGLVSTLKASGS
jgi:4,5-dihydroxyphthalate decarboxylase